MNEPLILDLVFEGGGMKGNAFIGALRALTTRGIRPGRLLGSSVGSLFATLLAAGYSGNELYRMALDPQGGMNLSQHFKRFPSFESEQADTSATRRLLKSVDLLKIPNFIEDSLDTLLARKLLTHSSLKNAFAFIENGGLYDPKPFVEWITGLLEAKVGSRTDTPVRDLTLAQFFAITEHHLSLIVADVTNPTMLILNHQTAPDCPLIQAVRMATAAPPIFQPVEWQSEWGFSLGRN